MTTLTIIKDDGFVAVDGVGLLDLDCSGLASNIHAIQFDGSNGEVEYNDGTASLAITAISDYQPQIDLHTAAIPAVVSEADRFAALTYDLKRKERYATLQNQLDQQYHDAVDGTTTWKDAVAAIKATYPKP